MSQAIDRSDARAGEEDVAAAEDVVRRRSSRIPIASQCDAEIWGSVKATVRGMMTTVDPDYTLAQFVEDALAAEVARLQVEHHDNRPWPAAKDLRRGRRVTPE